MTEPPVVAVTWLDSLASDPLKYFMGLVILALTWAIVTLGKRYLDIIPQAIAAIERNTAAQNGVAQAIDRQTATVEKLRDIVYNHKAGG